MGERLTRDEIDKRYPNQWVGLVDVIWEDESNVESAVVKYTDKTKDELLLMQISGEIFSYCTIPEYLTPIISIDAAWL